MTRQETVIKIAKITRIIGEWKYRYDLDGEVEMETLSPEILYIDEWVKDIYKYIEKDSSPLLSRLIMNIGFTEMLDDYIHKHKAEIDPAYYTVLENYVVNMNLLVALCDKYRDKRKGQYQNLIEPLANEQVASLLQRAVNAGILDKDYQPMPKTKVIELKTIAYAISSICKFKHPYNLFEKLWRREDGYRISTCRIPKFRSLQYDIAKNLYPEVDFSGMAPIKKIEVFYTEQSEDDKLTLFKSLLKYGYISSNTTFNDFNGIFSKEQFSSPVEWVKDQRQLAYFLFHAFEKFNGKKLWIKGECCFRINGKVPHVASLSTGYSCIKRSKWTDRFDIRLKEICDTFNHKENHYHDSVVQDVLPIHTSKCVFHSSAGPRTLTAMYKALKKEGYIDANTELEVFKGLFDESEFKGPVVWLKSQNLLSYLVYLAFKRENPFDIWKKCVYCFRYHDGKIPNRGSMDSNFRLIVKKGELDTLDVKLKTIAYNYSKALKIKKGDVKEVSPLENHIIT